MSVRESPPRRTADELARELQRARAHIGALEQLLEVHEQTSLEQATRLERSNRELDQFAYVASHDLKAPLRGIASLAQWIEEDLGDRFTDESREHMRLLRVRVNRMAALIDGILAYSRAGRVRESSMEIEVDALIGDVIELLDLARGTTVVVETPLPTLCTERVALQQVFMNLISNAVKHGRRDDPRVTIRCDDAGDLVRFAIADNGPGIAPQFHDKIWQMFQTLAPRDHV
ncbi:MAG TPA: ATP-binding protein, partial [Gemmatimonadaceae bacterium]|nr:ATP-binding protein [Gemmatimonadaceae bacterium]